PSTSPRSLHDALPIWIIAAAAAPDVPAALADQLAEGGVMITPIGGRRDEQRLVRVRRDASGFTTEELVRAHFVPMVASVGDSGIDRKSTRLNSSHVKI